MNQTNRRIAMIVIFILAVAVVAVSIVRIRSLSPNEATGGSGQLPVGYLILRGYDTPSNNTSRIPIGHFLTSAQQTKIRTSLENILFKTDSKKDYTGKIIPNTVNIDHGASVVSFEVEIEDPKSTYKITYNTVSNELHIFDSEGTNLSN